MKKLLLILGLSMFSNLIWSQCVPSCSNYIGTSIPFSSIPIVGHNTVTLGDEELSTPLPIGFNFQFFCNTESQFLISSNGWITFNLSETNTSASAAYLPDPGYPVDLIALYWYDLDPSVGGTITYTTVGTAPNRQCIISFVSVPLYNDNNTLNTGQIILYETSNTIEIQTGSIGTDFFDGGTQGIENSDGSMAYTIPGSNYDYLTITNTGYRFFLGGVPAAPSSITGPGSNICEGTQVMYSVTQVPGATYTWITPQGWFGTNSGNVYNAAAGVSGQIEVSATYTCGTSPSVFLPVNVTPAPHVGITSAMPQIICSGNTVTITPSGATAYTLEPGGYTGSSSFIITPGVSTTYSLFGTDATNCTSYNDAHSFITVNETPTVTVNSGAVCSGQPFTIIAAGADAYSYSSGFPTITPLTGIQSYSVVGTNTNGCVGAVAVSMVTVSPTPTITISATKTMLCKSETTTITASGADSYAWNGGTSAAANPVTPLTTTIYTVTGTNTTGNCSKTSVITINVMDCTGLSEIEKAKNAVAVYPNPSTGEFTITSPQATTIMIYDIQGKVVLTQVIEAGNTTVNINQHASGQYLFKAVSENTVQSMILIKE